MISACTLHRGPDRRSGRKRLVAALVGLLALLVTLSACGGRATSASASTGGKKALASLKLITFPGMYYFTDVVAQQEGFFAKHGLNVQFIKPQAGTSALQLLLSGSVDGLINDGALSVLPASKGQDIKIIGSIYNKNAWKIYVSDKDSSLFNVPKGFPQRILALRGKTIGVTAIDAGTDLALQAILKAAGMNPDTAVHRVGIGLLQAAVGQFQAGKLDAYVFNAPAGSVLGQAHLAREYFDFATDAPPEFANIPQGTLITSGAWLSDHASTAHAWIAAEEEALKWAENSANLDAAAKLFASAYGGTVAAARTSVTFLQKDVYPETAPSLKVSRSLFNNEVNLLVKVGLLSSASSASYSKIVAPFAQG